MAGLLARARWTPAQLADRVNERGRNLGFGAVLIERRNARRWIQPDSDRAKPSTPRDPVPELACLVLSERIGEVVTPETLGWSTPGHRQFVFADDGLSESWSARGALDSMAHVVDPGHVERRHFLSLTGVSLTAVAHQWLFDPARVAASLLGDRVTDDVVDDLEVVADACRRMDDKLGGGTLLPSIREELRLVVAMLRNASYTETVGKRLHGVAAEFGRLAGWVAFDSGDYALAQRYFIAAMHNAHVSGDRAVGANVLAFMSIQAERSPIPQDAVDLTRSALHVEKELPPAVASWLQCRLATSSARVGDEYASRRAQDRAVELLGRSNPDEEPSWIYWFSAANLEYPTGEAAFLLGRFDEAEINFRSALSLLDPRFSRDRGLILCDLAQARLAAGAVDHACSTAGEAATVIRRLNSKHDRRRLAEFRQAITPHARTMAVREFDDKHGDLISVAST